MELALAKKINKKIIGAGETRLAISPRGHHYDLKIVMVKGGRENKPPNPRRGNKG